MIWYPYPKPGDPDFYKEEGSDDASDGIKSKALLKQPLLSSTKLFDKIFNITIIPSQKKYTNTIGYGTRHIIAEANCIF